MQAPLACQPGIQRHTGHQRDGTHQQWQVEAVPDGNLVIGQRLARQGRGRHLRQRAERGRREQPHRDARHHQQDGRGFHAQRWLVRVGVGHVAQRAVEPGVMHQADRVRHAEHPGQRHRHGQRPAQQPLRARDRFGKEHFFRQEAVGQRYTGHGRGRQHAQRGRPGHQAPQATQLAHVTRVGFVVNDARNHEQRRLEGGVVQHMKHRSQARQWRADADQARHQTQVTDR